MSGPKGTDWWAWHAPYDDPSSPLSRRLATVITFLTSALDEGARRVLSLCAGQGLDVLGAFARHGGPGLEALLVEADERNVARAEELAAAVPGASVTVACCDASVTDAVVGFAPADVVVACGIFGNLSASDARAFVDQLPSLVVNGGQVIWTRHRRPPDQTGSLRRWFAASGFEEVAFTTPAGTVAGVGAHRLVGSEKPLRPGRRLFRFVGDGHLPA